jgi:hypothetical protein
MAEGAAHRPITVASTWKKDKRGRIFNTEPHTSNHKGNGYPAVVPEESLQIIDVWPASF